MDEHWSPTWILSVRVFGLIVTVMLEPSCLQPDVLDILDFFFFFIFFLSHHQSFKYTLKFTSIVTNRTNPI